MLETAAIASRIEIPEVALSPAQEEALAFAVREAITNVVRQSGARSATIRLAAVDDTYLLEIRDDRSGGDMLAEGAGPRGMRARIQALGGTVRREAGSGRVSSFDCREQPHDSRHHRRRSVDGAGSSRGATRHRARYPGCRRRRERQRSAHARRP